jgi:DNA mismatch endonuclease (patch repair protein)
MMADVFTREKRSEIMSKIHQPTRLERTVHNWLCGARIRHRMYPRVEGSPDIVIFPDGGDPVYVFVDGCQWHCCPLHYRRPKSNTEFWIRHIEESNRRREELRGRLPYRWTRIWEHEVKNGSFKRRILEAVAVADCELAGIEVDGRICKNRIDVFRGGKLIFVPDACSFIKICDDCYKRLMKKKYIKEVGGVLFYYPFDCRHKKRVKKVLNSNLREVVTICETCFTRHLKEGWITKAHGYALGKWL